MADARALSLGYRSMWGGIAAAFIGAASLVGYLFDLPVPLVVEVLPGQHSPMALTAALCLLLAGIALVLRALHPACRPAAHLAAAVVMLLAVADLAAFLPAVEPEVAVASGAVARGGAPLRMGVEIAFFLLFFGATYFTANRRNQRGGTPWLRAGLAVQVVVAIWALLGQLSDGSSMAQLAALGLAALAWASYETRHGVTASDTLARLPPELRLQQTSALGLIVFAGGALLLGFDLAQWRFQRQVEIDIAQRVNERAQLIASEFDSFIERGKLVASRPRTRDLLLDNVHIGGGDWREQLNGIARSYLSGGYSAIAFLDAQQRVVAGAGTFRGATVLSISYPSVDSARLLWDDGMYMQIDVPVYDNGRIVGHAVTQQPLEHLTRMLRSGIQWGVTGEIVVCSSESSGVICFPTRFRDAPFTLDGSDAALGNAAVPDLDSQRAAREMRDYRGRAVIAAYRTITPPHLFVGGKMDLDEVDAPFVQAFSMGLLALVMFILAAHVYGRLSVRPLAEALIAARDNAAEGEVHFRSIVEHSLDAIFSVKSRRDASGEVVDFEFTYANEAAERLLGRHRTEIIGQTLCGLLPWARSTGWFERCKKAIDTEQSADADLRADLPQAAGAWIQMHAVPLGDGLAIEVRGINDRKSAQERVRQMAPIDALTDLPNRALFIDRLERSMIRMRRRRGTMALLDLDIDHFGEINEKRGHATGDVLLRTFAERISRCLRAEDTVARVGGDEFAVIIEGLRDRGEALRAADAILAAARREIALPTGTIRVSSSIGIAFFDGENGSVQQLLDEAHGARLKVQSGGGDAYFYADAPVGAVELQDPSNDANL